MAGLRDEHAVERIGVVAGQSTGGEGVRHGDRERREAKLRDEGGETVNRKMEAAERMLDGDFPHGGRGDVNGTHRIRDNFARRGRQALRGEQGPKEDVGVDKEVHLRNRFTWGRR